MPCHCLTCAIEMLAARTAGRQRVRRPGRIVVAEAIELSPDLEPRGLGPTYQLAVEALGLGARRTHGAYEDVEGIARGLGAGGAARVAEHAGEQRHARVQEAACIEGRLERGPVVRIDGAERGRRERREALKELLQLGGSLHHAGHQEAATAAGASDVVRATCAKASCSSLARPMIASSRSALGFTPITDSSPSMKV